MQITKYTKTQDLLPLLDDEKLKYLLEQADIVPAKSIFTMTCGEFLETQEEDWCRKFEAEEYAMDFLGKLKFFKSEMEKLEKFLALNKVEETQEEKNAQRGIVFPTFDEQVLITVTEYFHLKSFDEAENVPFSNYLLIHKKQSADAKYNRNLNKIYQQQSQSKNRR